MENRITKLFGIEQPIIQAGMVWCSGWRLAAAVSNAGGLGLLGAGSMHPTTLEEHIIKCKAATTKPFGVNVPLLYPNIDRIMQIIIDHQVKIVFTSAGNPALWTSKLKANNITVVHVVSSSKFALKSQQAGVDAVVAEGFEAGGHNGREETTTLCLIPQVCQAVSIPVIAAGGIASGQAWVAAEALGAEAVQIGTLFAACSESSAHENFKTKITQLNEGDTVLTMKQLTPVRLIKNNFFAQIAQAEKHGATAAELELILGKGKAKKGIFEGDIENGELEIGQIASTIKTINSAAAIINTLLQQYQQTKQRLTI